MYTLGNFGVIFEHSIPIWNKNCIIPKKRYITYYQIVPVWHKMLKNYNDISLCAYLCKMDAEPKSKSACKMFHTRILQFCAQVLDDVWIY